MERESTLPEAGVQRQKKRTRSELVAEAEAKRQKKTTEEIPDDLVAHILSRLPAKTVTRFKCVSKQWYSLISDPWFINLHHHYSIKNFELFYITFGAEDRCSFRFTSTDIEGKVLKEFTQEEGIRGCVNIGCVGSANGLMCFKTRDFKTFYQQIYLCDPVTRQLLALPLHSPSPRLRPVSLAIGFGYLFSTNEYKIMRCVEVEKDKTHCEILSFVAGSKSRPSWRIIDKEVTGELQGASVFVNGCLHWLYTTSCRNKPIISFDLRREKFKILPSPPNTTQYSRFKLVNLGGILSLTGFVGCILVIWMLKDYDKHIWIKAYTIDFHLVNPRMSCFRAILQIPNGQLLIIPTHPGEIYFYNIVNKKLRAGKIPQHKGELCFESMRWL